jgi:glycine/D-amino acid oxidase-like deaminating enzyme
MSASLPRSLYADTAPPGPATPPLDGDVRADVAVVGAGFTGLSAALHLAEQGTDVRVLEANEVGWGASGRNGGQVNPGLKFDPDQIEADFGAEMGRRMAAFSGAAPQRVFDLIERHQIVCEARRDGTIRAAKSEVRQTFPPVYHVQPSPFLASPGEPLARACIQSPHKYSVYHLITAPQTLLQVQRH